MANELDKTIEELEAEVLSELEEANGQDAPMKSAGKADPMEKPKAGTPKGEVQDTGAPVVDGKSTQAPSKKTAAAAKEIGGDAQQKGEGAPDKMDTGNDGMKKVAKPLAAGFEADGDEELSEMGHKDEMAKMPKTKMELMTAMKDMMGEMEKMKKDKLMATYNAMNNAMHEMGHEEMSPEEKVKNIVQQTKPDLCFYDYENKKIINLLKKIKVKCIKFKNIRENKEYINFNGDNLIDNGDGSYTCTLEAQDPSNLNYYAASSLMIMIQLHGRNISNSPFRPIIVPPTVARSRQQHRQQLQL